MIRRTVLLAAAAALLVAGCSGGKDAVVQGSSFSFVSPGGQVDISYDVPKRQPAPTLSGDDLMHDGKQLSLADFPGKVIVLNLWGQWCGPCRSEAPELESLSKQTASLPVQVVGIDVKDPAKDVAQDFVRDRGLTYPSIYDSEGRTLMALTGYPRNVIPSTLVLDKQHRVAAVFLRSVLATDLLPVVHRLAAE